MCTQVIPNESLDDLIYLVNQNLTKCSSVKNTLSATLTYENELSKLTSQFLYDLSYDLRTLQGSLERINIYNKHLITQIENKNCSISAYNAKISQLQNNILEMESALKDEHRRNIQLIEINKGYQNYINEKLKCNCCKCTCCQSLYNSFNADNSHYGLNKSMMSSTYEYDEFNKQNSPILNSGRYIDKNKLNFYYDGKDQFNYYYDQKNPNNYQSVYNNTNSLSMMQSSNQEQNQPQNKKQDEDKQKRIQKIIMEVFKDENTLNKLKEKFGDDLETKLTKTDLNDSFINQLEQELFDINQENLNNSIEHDNGYTGKISKRFQIIQKAKAKKKGKSPSKDQLKKEIISKQYPYKEYPRGWNSSKDYFVNNNSSGGRMEKSPMKITNVLK